MARILLIEDDPETGESILAMLEQCGHQVHWSLNGKEALASLESVLRVDLVLTDILMPDMDGIETIQHLRKHLPGLPLVAMTAQRQMPYLRAATLFGVKGTLQKPFTPEELETTLRAVLQG